MEAGAGPSSLGLSFPSDSPMPFPSPSPSTTRRFRSTSLFPTVRSPGCPQSCSLQCMPEVSGKGSLSNLGLHERMPPKQASLSLVCAGPISSILVNRYGSRPVVMVGGILVSTGMVLASFGTSIIHLYLCVGVIGGKYIFFSFFNH